MSNLKTIAVKSTVVAAVCVAMLSSLSANAATPEYQVKFINNTDHPMNIQTHEVNLSTGVRSWVTWGQELMANQSILYTSMDDGVTMANIQFRLADKVGISLTCNEAVLTKHLNKIKTLTLNMNFPHLDCSAK